MESFNRSRLGDASPFDRHRFGKTVKKESGRFLKPRSTRLEALLLDRTASPRQIADELDLLPPSIPYRAELTAQDRRWSGWATDLGPFATDHVSPDQATGLAERAGALLAKATLLGLADLHGENILVVREAALHPVPVDLEIAFWNCASGMDTLIFPSRLVTPERSGIQSLLPHLRNPDVPYALLRGFLTTAKKIAAQVPGWLHALDHEMQGQPVRVLLRSSWLYRRLLLGENPLLVAGPLLPEEKLQLDAGDIPYFFVEWGDPDRALRYESRPGVFEAAMPGPFAGVVAHATPDIETLGSPDRIERLIQVTAIHLVRNLSIQGEGILRNDGRITLRTPEFEVSALDHGPSGSAGSAAARDR